MIQDHAPLPPSGAPQWGNCSGSVMAQMQIPEKENPRQRAGIASHWVAAEALISYRDTELGLACCEDWLGKTAPNGVVIDEEMAEGAQEFVNHCLDIAGRTNSPSRMLIEHRVHMPKIHQHNWGTLDFALVQFAEEWLDYKTANARKQKIVNIYLSDYKFGHREVRAEGNLQLIDYAAGLIEELQIDGYEDQQIRVHFSVVQPFAYHARGTVDTWVVTLSDLRAYFNQLIAKAYEAFSAPKCTSGPWCRDCRAVLRCDTSKRSKYSLIDYVDQAVALDTYDAATLGTEYGILIAGAETLKARIEAIEEELRHQISQGRGGSGYTVEATTGRLAFTVDDAVAIAFCKQFGVDASKPGTITPTQALGKASKEQRETFEQALKQITEKPQRGLKLIPAKDSRTARAFKKD